MLKLYYFPFRNDTEKLFYIKTDQTLEIKGRLTEELIMFTNDEERTIIKFIEIMFRKLREEGVEAHNAPQKEVCQEQEPLNRLIPVTKWEEYHNWPKIGGLRNLIQTRHRNGFAKCLRRSGKRLLISERDFFEWIDETGVVQ